MPILLYFAAPALAVYMLYRRFTTRVSPTIPYAGEGSLRSRFNALAEYNSYPIEFFKKQREKLGDVFCVDLLLIKVVYVLGVEGNKSVLHAAESELSFWEVTERFLGPFIRKGASWNQKQNDHSYISQCRVTSKKLC